MKTQTTTPMTAREIKAALPTRRVRIIATGTGRAYEVTGVEVNPSPMGASYRVDTVGGPFVTIGAETLDVQVKGR